MTDWNRLYYLRAKTLEIVPGYAHFCWLKGKHVALPTAELKYEFGDPNIDCYMFRPHNGPGWYRVFVDEIEQDMDVMLGNLDALILKSQFQH